MPTDPSVSWQPFERAATALKIRCQKTIVVLSVPPTGARCISSAGLSHRYCSRWSILPGAAGRAGG